MRCCRWCVLKPPFALLTSFLLFLPFSCVCPGFYFYQQRFVYCVIIITTVIIRFSSPSCFLFFPLLNLLWWYLFHPKIHLLKERRWLSLSADDMLNLSWQIPLFSAFHFEVMTVFICWSELAFPFSLCRESSLSKQWSKSFSPPPTDEWWRNYIWRSIFARYLFGNVCNPPNYSPKYPFSEPTYRSCRPNQPTSLETEEGRSAHSFCFPLTFHSVCL